MLLSNSTVVDLFSLFYFYFYFHVLTYYIVECNYLYTLVGEEYEDYLRQNPESEPALHYRRLLRRVTVNGWVPLHDLILEHSQSLSKSPSTERFKKKYVTFCYIVFICCASHLFVN